MKEKTTKSHPLVTALIVLAIVSFVAGVVIISISEKGFINDNLVGPFFALAGVFIVGAALHYQSSEYKVQLEEFKNSVKALEKTSSALEAQKNLLLKQNTDQLLFNVIENFTQFKNRKEINGSIIAFFNRFYPKFGDYYHNREFILSNKDSKEPVKLSSKIIIAANNTFQDFRNREHVKNYLIFAFNVYSLIDKTEIIESKKWFTPFFFNQFTPEEVLIIYLSRFFENTGLLNEPLKWNYETVKQLLEIISRSDSSFDIKSVDINALIQDLNNFQQD